MIRCYNYLLLQLLCLIYGGLLLPSEKIIQNCNYKTEFILTNLIFNFLITDFEKQFSDLSNGP